MSCWAGPGSGTWHVLSFNKGKLSEQCSKPPCLKVATYPLTLAAGTARRLPMGCLAFLLEQGGIFKRRFRWKHNGSEFLGIISAPLPVTVLKVTVHTMIKGSKCHMKTHIRLCVRETETQVFPFGRGKRIKLCRRKWILNDQGDGCSLEQMVTSSASDLRLGRHTGHQA